MISHGDTGVTVGADYSITSGSIVYSGSFESANVSNDGQMDLTRNSVGDSLAKNYYDVTEEKGTFKFATRTQNFNPGGKGSMWTIAALSSKANAYLTGSNWILENYRVDDSNTTARRCEFDMSRNANITT